MFPKKPFLQLILLSLISNTIICQNIFRDGYIIKNNGEILDGLIGYKPNQDIPAKCAFKRFDIAVEITYKPYEIKAFGYTGGSRFESKRQDGKDSFYGVLASGNINLYRKGSKFFLEKGQAGLVDLSSGSNEYSVDGQQQKFDGLTSFLKYITEGKVINIKGKINPKKDLLSIIAEYNKESGNHYIVYNNKFSEKMLISESLRSGANHNRFGIYSGMNIYILKITSESNWFIRDPEPEITPVIGLSYERMISRKSDKLALRLDFTFLKQNFYAYSEETEIFTLYRHDFFFDFSGIKLSPMLQYSFTSGKLVPYMTAGLSYMTYIQKNYLHILETIHSNNEVFTSESNTMDFNSGEFAGLLGAGIKLRLLNNINLNIQGRMEVGQGLFTGQIKKIASYSQLSLQPTLMVGITF
jgi:hypothetical protein